MLLRLKVKNFLSFYEETTFDMFPNLKRTTFENHIYRDMEIPLLKQAAIYGANGSGKSNLLEVIKFIKLFAKENDFINGDDISLNKFQLAGKINSEPISVSIEFFHKEIYFIYEVEINDNGIQKEELYQSGIGKKNNELIYSRHLDSITQANTISEDLENSIRKYIKANPLSSSFAIDSVFTFIKDERVKVAYDWFKDKIEVLSLRSVNPSIISLMSNNSDLLLFTNKLFTKIGLGIEKLEINEKSLNEIMLDDSDESNRIKKHILNRPKDINVSLVDNDKVLYNIVDENGEDIVKRFAFKQLGIDGYLGNLEYGAQSDGTARVLNLIPVLYEIVNNNCVFFIDEIENSIHPTLMIALLKFFSETNTKGQLIFTTHETELLNQKELMRPDEVWFTEKKNGNTHLYSLNDFKEHNTLNIKNGYLEGRYGAIPFIGNLNE